jgi:hypothetical protein
MPKEPKPKRYLCQFREWDKTYYTTDCGFDKLSQARNYVDTVVDTLHDVGEGRVLDVKTKRFVYYRGK